MVDCSTCEFENICEMPDFIRNDIKKCRTYKEKVELTNEERIKNMSDKELAYFLTEQVLHGMLFYFGKEDVEKINFDKENDAKIKLDWLHSKNSAVF